MSFFRKDKKEAPEVREYEGVVKRMGLLDTYDIGPDYYVMLLEGVAEPIKIWTSNNVAFALTSPGDFVSFNLARNDNGTWYLASFQNFALGLND
jgi:hypothetical protein